jgi:hypothetical protein
MKNNFRSVSRVLLAGLVLGGTGCVMVEPGAQPPMQVSDARRPALYALALEFEGDAPSSYELAALRRRFADYFAKEGCTLVGETEPADFLVRILMAHEDPDNPREWSVVSSVTERIEHEGIVYDETYVEPSPPVFVSSTYCGIYAERPGGRYYGYPNYDSIFWPAVFGAIVVIAPRHPHDHRQLEPHRPPTNHPSSDHRQRADDRRPVQPTDRMRHDETNRPTPPTTGRETQTGGRDQTPGWRPAGDQLPKPPEHPETTGENVHNRTPHDNSGSDAKPVVKPLVKPGPTPNPTPRMPPTRQPDSTNVTPPKHPSPPTRPATEQPGRPHIQHSNTPPVENNPPPAKPSTVTPSHGSHTGDHPVTPPNPPPATNSFKPAVTPPSHPVTPAPRVQPETRHPTPPAPAPATTPTPAPKTHPRDNDEKEAK